MTTGTLSQLDGEQMRLEAELESVSKELDTYRNTNSRVINSRNYLRHSHHSIDQSPSLTYHPLQHRHSDSSLDSIHHSRKRQPSKHRDSIDCSMGGENPFSGTHMMQMLLEQQARVYCKDNEMLQKEMDNLKVSDVSIFFSIM